MTVSDGPPFTDIAFLPALGRQVCALAGESGRVLVGIDGPSCAGKSELARQLAAELGGSVLPLDAFFVLTTPAGAAPDERRWRLDLDAFRAAIVRLAAGQPVHFDGFDWDTDRIVRHEVQPGIVIAEGVGALRADLRGLYDLRIWVQGDTASQMARIRHRDGDRYAARWQEEWLPAERRYIATERPFDAADLIVAGAGLDLTGLGRQLHPA